jgi:hypothetical protein
MLYFSLSQPSKQASQQASNPASQQASQQASYTQQNVCGKEELCSQLSQ